MFELEGRRAEVQEEAVVDAGGGEVVDELGFVPGVEGADGLEFENEAALDDNVGLVMPDADAVVVDVEGDFLLDGESLLGELQQEGVLVDFFEEAGAESVVDGHGGTNDGMGQFFKGHGAILSGWRHGSGRWAGRQPWMRLAGTFFGQDCRIDRMERMDARLFMDGLCRGAWRAGLEARGVPWNPTVRSEDLPPTNSEQPNNRFSGFPVFPTREVDKVLRGPPTF